MKLRVLSFPLIVALAVASSAHADGDRGNNKGNAYGHDKQISSSDGYQSQADVGHDARKGLYKAAAAYKSAWKKPDSDNLIGALKTYHEAALNAVAVMGRESGFAGEEKVNRYFADELKRVNAHFEEMHRREQLWSKFKDHYQALTAIEVGNNPKDDRAKGMRHYTSASKALVQIEEFAKVKEARAKLEAAYHKLKVASSNQEAKIKRTTKGVEKVKGSGSSEIDTHSVCKIVTNDAGKQIFVSARTKEEWATHNRSFLKNLPAGVTAKDCPPPPTTTSGGDDKDKDRPNYRKKGYDLGDGRKDKCDDRTCD